MINVYSEIGKLKTVLLHYPGEELNNLIPRYLEELLFDDIPWLPLARAEHDAFANAFRNAGVKVVYLEDLVADVLKDSEIKEKFVKEFVSEASIHSETLKEIVTDYLMGITDSKELVLKTMAGIKKSEMESDKKITLTDYVVDYPFVCNPMPNLYFTRDPFASIYDGICLNKMYSATRSRETIYAKYIFLYHKDYKGTKLFYNRDNELNIEGGDILVLNKETLIVGVSERTHSGAIEKLAKNMFYEQKTSLKRVLAFTIPKMRTFMHLDTIFTQVDYDKFTIHKECYETLKVYEVTKDEEKVGKLKVKELNNKLEDILEAYIGKKVTLIPCGGEDSVSAAREQWSDGSNTIAIAPGEVIAYERNDITNKTLKNYGITVHTIPSSELSRGRGGPRCMCMPLERE
ncbi:MAG: arginine deiminase [Bacilli bacterium]|nr:arginine deiminase [Bacilli bacterium]MBO7536332.1 arginine deiminase [Bacilli bacterium]